MSTGKTAVAVAHPNIALIKYWGKRDDDLNLPATGSLSITLDTLATRTEVSFDDDLAADHCELDGAAATPAAAARVSACLDLLRSRAAITTRARVISSNNFPTAAGLASSASGFAALVTAADAALGLGLCDDRRSELARRGSGSAARSIYGGFVEMRQGERSDGADSIAAALHAPDYWPLRVVLALTELGKKPVSSTAGMRLTAHTSPYFDGWVSSSATDVAAAKRALAARDFERLATVAERSCLKMHGLMMSADPGLIYMRAATLACMHRIRALRANGIKVFFTVDAGPQVKAVCSAGAEASVAKALRAVKGVSDVMTVGLGGGARMVSA